MLPALFKIGEKNRRALPARAAPSIGRIPRTTPRLAGFLAFVIGLITPLAAGDVRDDWARVTRLDSGPASQPSSSSEAAAVILAHLDRQEQALRDFLKAHPRDEHAFEAGLRLARLLDQAAELKELPRPAEAGAILKSLGKDAGTAARRTELDFAVLAHRMRAFRGKRPAPDERRAILDQARSFEKAHPGDRRIPALLAEVATLFDSEPETKQTLLRDAKKNASDPVVQAQIADDLRRLSYLGKSLPLRFDALDGSRADAKDWRGKVVAVVFFATWSEPSTNALAEIQQAVARTGSDAMLVAISLDGDRTVLESFVRKRKIPGPVAWAQKGWDSPLIKALGINALPAVWLLDREGIVRSLDALDDPVGQIRRLLEMR
jgi:hypothetical protein